MTAKSEGAQLLVRMPPELRQWIEQQATKNWTSLNAEVVRSIRNRMESEQARAAS